MIKYFKELEDPAHQYLSLLDNRPVKKSIEVNQIPLDKAIEAIKILKELDELNPLMLDSNDKNKIYIHYTNLKGADSIVDEEEKEREYCNINIDLDLSDVEDKKDFEYLDIPDDLSDIPFVECDFEEKDLLKYRMNSLYSSIISGFPLEDEGITRNGRDKIRDILSYTLSLNNNLDYLNKLDSYEKDKNIIIDYGELMSRSIDTIEDLFREDKILVDKWKIFFAISNRANLLKIQGRLSKNLEVRVNEIKDYIYNYNIYVTDRDFLLYNMELYNAWFITPYNHLFNTLGYYKAHEVSNLKSYYYNLLDSIDSMDEVKIYETYKSCLESIKDRLDKHWITVLDYSSTFNLRWDCFILRLEDYYLLDCYDKIRYDYGTGKCYDKKIIDIYNGLNSAQGAIYEFFYELKKNSNDFERDIKTVKSLCFTDFLVRCCGLHKVESQVEKTITTSCINYEEEFSEYIKKGWKIEFIPPYIVYDGQLVKYPKDFLTIRRVLKLDK